jgi:hypothetical protein
MRAYRVPTACAREWRGEEKRTRTYLAIGAGVPMILPCAFMIVTHSHGRTLALRRAGGLSAAAKDAQRKGDARNDLRAGRASYAHFLARCAPKNGCAGLCSGSKCRSKALPGRASAVLGASGPVLLHEGEEHGCEAAGGGHGWPWPG